MIKIKILYSLLLSTLISINSHGICTTPVSDIALIFSTIDRATKKCAQSDVSTIATNMVDSTAEFCSCANTIMGAASNFEKSNIEISLNKQRFVHDRDKKIQELNDVNNSLVSHDNSLRVCTVSTSAPMNFERAEVKEKRNKDFLNAIVATSLNGRAENNTKPSDKKIKDSIDIAVLANPDLKNSDYYKILKLKHSKNNSQSALLNIIQAAVITPFNDSSFSGIFKRATGLTNNTELQQASLKLINNQLKNTNIKRVLNEETCNELKKLKLQKAKTFLDKMQEFNSQNDPIKKKDIVKNMMSELSYDNKVNFQAYFCSLDQKKQQNLGYEKSPVCESISNKTQPKSGLNLREECYKFEKGIEPPGNELEKLFKGSLENKIGFQKKDLNPFLIKLEKYIQIANQLGMSGNREADKKLKDAIQIRKNLIILKKFDDLNFKVTKLLNKSPLLKSDIDYLNNIQRQQEKLTDLAANIYSDNKSNFQNKLTFEHFDKYYTKVLIDISEKGLSVESKISDLSLRYPSRHKRARKTVTVDQSGSNSPGATTVVDKSALNKTVNPDGASTEDSTETVTAKTNSEAKDAALKDNSTDINNKAALLPKQPEPAVTAGQPTSNPIVANIPTETTAYRSSEPAANSATVQDLQEATPKNNASVVPVKDDNPQSPSTSTSEELERMREQIAELTAAKKETKKAPVNTSRDGNSVVLGGGSNSSSSSSSSRSKGNPAGPQDQLVHNAAPIVNNPVQNPQAVDPKVQDQHPTAQKITGNESAATSSAAPLTLTETRYKPADITSDKTVVEFHISKVEFDQKTEQQKEEIIYAELEDAVTSNDVKEGDVIKIGNELIPITKELIAQIKAKKLAKENKIAEAAATATKKVKARQPANKKKKVTTQEGQSVTTQQLLDAAQ